MDNRVVEISRQHYCDTCKFMTKCNYFRKIVMTLDQIQMDALDDMNVDLEIEFKVEGCKRYAPDLEALLMRGEIEIIEEDDDDEGEDTDGR